MRKRRVEKIQRGVLLFKTKLFCALINPRAHQADLLSGQRLRGRTEIARPVTRGIRALRATRWRFARRRTTGTTLRAAIMRLHICWVGTGWWATRAARSPWPARTTRTALRRHRDFRIQLRNGSDNQAVRAVAHRQNGSVFGSFQNAFQCVEPKLCARPHGPMAAHARGFEQWLDIVGKSDATLG